MPGCVTCHASVTHFRPILGNVVEVTLMTDSDILVDSAIPLLESSHYRLECHLVDTGAMAHMPCCHRTWDFETGSVCSQLGLANKESVAQWVLPLG